MAWVASVDSPVRHLGAAGSLSAPGLARKGGRMGECGAEEVEVCQKSIFFLRVLLVVCSRSFYIILI